MCVVCVQMFNKKLAKLNAEYEKVMYLCLYVCVCICVCVHDAFVWLSLSHAHKHM